MSDEMRAEMKQEIKEELREEMRREMRWHRVPRAMRVLIVAVLVFTVMFLVGWLVMSLWNWLLPALFGFKTIGYWQAIGLMVLSRLLFGGFRAMGSRSGDGHGRRFARRWERMTPEEREKFRQAMRQWCEQPHAGAPPTAF
jgi:energy-coupling factor transporter transmembrane protein EcfT